MGPKLSIFTSIPRFSSRCAARPEIIQISHYLPSFISYVFLTCNSTAELVKIRNFLLNYLRYPGPGSNRICLIQMLSYKRFFLIKSHLKLRKQAFLLSKNLWIIQRFKANFSKFVEDSLFCFHYEKIWSSIIMILDSRNCKIIKIQFAWDLS